MDDAIDDLLASLDRTFGSDDATDGNAPSERRNVVQLKTMETHVRILPPVSMGKGVFSATMTFFFGLAHS